MKRKIVFIDEEKCNGCGLCIPSCAEGAIKIIDGKARLVDVRFCDGLGACIENCPQDAIYLIEREAPAFDEHVVKMHLDKVSRKPKILSCPGSHEMELRSESSALRQWHVQLALVSPQASYFKDSELLVAADCVPFAYPDFHAELLHGKSLVWNFRKF